MKGLQKKILNVLMLLLWSFTVSATVQPSCNISSACFSWTANTCLQKQIPSSSAAYLNPSPDEMRESYNVCPVISKWNLTKETNNVTDVIKEVRSFVDWLCKMPCDRGSSNITRECINRRIEDYKNISSPMNTTLLQGNQTVFRLTLARELHRLELIANKPMPTYEDIRRRIDHLANIINIQLNTSKKNDRHLDDKGKTIMHVNEFIAKLNMVRNLSFADVQLNASIYDIQSSVEQLERLLLNQSATTSTWYSPVTSHATITNVIQPSVNVYASSCFVARFHCATKTECPGQTSSKTSTELLRSVFKTTMAKGSLYSTIATSTSATYQSASSITPTPTARASFCLYDCNGTCNGTAIKDCANVCGGTAMTDDCGVCTEGSTGKRRNYLKDCSGVCHGKSTLDACNVCEQPSKHAGNRSIHQDCNMVCFGTATKDSCGLCVGGDTGRAPSVPDACGVYCNGDNSTCKGCDNVPNSGKVFDACGVCGGKGDTCTTITNVFPHVVHTDVRRVIVQGAGLNGTRIYCTVGSNSVIGISLNITAAQCTLPARQQIGEVELRLQITKQNRNTTVGPLSLFYYNAASLSFTTVSPNEIMKKSMTSVIVTGAGFQKTNISNFRIQNSTYALSFKAIYINDTAFKCTLPSSLVPGLYNFSIYMNGIWSVTREKSQLFALEILSEPPKILEAKFSDSGSQLIVKFTSLQPLIRNCSKIFASNVTKSLGIAPTCTWVSNTELRITTGRNASILPGMLLVLRENVFRSLFHSKYATGSIVLKTSDTPLLPKPVLIGPSLISSCGDFELSAAQSTGSGGRPLTYKWKIESGSNKAKIQADLDRLSSTTDSILISHTDFTDTNDYVFSVSIANFLSSGNSVEKLYKIRKAMSPIPEVSLLTSSDPKNVLVAQDFYISAKVKPTSCTSNFTAGFHWSSSDSTLSSLESFLQTSGKQTLMISASKLTGGKTYPFKLSVFWMHDRNIKNDISLYFKTSYRSLVAAIKGGDFSVGTDSGMFSLDAKSLSHDPDDIDSSFRFAWSCTDKVSNGNCISLTSRSPIQLPSSGIIYINPSELKPRTYEFTVNVSSYNSNRWITAKSTITINVGRIPLVTIISGSQKVNPDRKFSMRAVVVAQGIVSLQWSTTAESRKIDFSANDIFITPPTNITDAFSNVTAYFVLKSGKLQPGAKYTIRLSVTDSHGTSYSQSSFMVSERPTSGQFDVKPSTVEALNDVTITASFWTISSDCLPLKYEFFSYGSDASRTSYGIHSEPKLVIPAPVGIGASNQLVLALKVYSACQTTTQRNVTITSTPPSSVSSDVVNNNMAKAAKAASSGDLASAVASLDSMLGVASSSGNNSLLKDIEAKTLVTVESMSKELPRTPSVSTSLLGILKKVEPSKLDASEQLQSIADTYKRVLDNLKNSDIESENLQKTIDRLADIDAKAIVGQNKNVSKTVLQSDELLASSLASKTGAGQPPFQTSDTKNRLTIKVAYSRLTEKIPSKSGGNSVDISFGKELADRCKNWKCSKTKYCEGVVVKIRNYRQSPVSIADSRFASTGTQIIDISLSNPVSGKDLQVTALSTPIAFNMTVGELQAGDVPKCVFYNKINNEWSQQGMRTLRISNTLVKCEATHLTSFAVIKDPLVVTTLATVAGETLDDFQLLFTLANHTWNSSLSNSSSSQALALKADVKKWLDGIFSTDPNYRGISGITFSKVNDVKVQVNFNLTFKSSTTSEATISTKIKDKNGSDGFNIDPASLSVTKKKGNVIEATKTTKTGTATSGINKAVLLAVIFGILAAIILLLIVYLVVKNVQKRSKAKIEPTAPPDP